MLTPEKKQKIKAALRKYSWEDLDWVEQLVVRLKGSATGIRVYRTDTPHQTREAISALSNFFDEAANQGP